MNQADGTTLRRIENTLKRIEAEIKRSNDINERFVASFERILEETQCSSAPH